jgi:hypothetical protein
MEKERHAAKRQNSLSHFYRVSEKAKITIERIQNA